jgi:hypothetical protein
MIFNQKLIGRLKAMTKKKNNFKGVGWLCNPEQSLEDNLSWAIDYYMSLHLGKVPQVCFVNPSDFAEEPRIKEIVNIFASDNITILPIKYVLQKNLLVGDTEER